MISSDGTYRELLRRWQAMDDGGCVRLRHVECGRPGRKLLCVEVGDRPAPTISIAAGVHGDDAVVGGVDHASGDASQWHPRRGRSAP